MTFWKRQNYGDSKRIRGCQDFWGIETVILHDAVVVDTLDICQNLQNVKKNE